MLKAFGLYCDYVLGNIFSSCLTFQIFEAKISTIISGELFWTTKENRPNVFVDIILCCRYIHYLFATIWVHSTHTSVMSCFFLILWILIHHYYYVCMWCTSYKYIWCALHRWVKLNTEVMLLLVFGRSNGLLECEHHMKSISISTPQLSRHTNTIWLDTDIYLHPFLSPMEDSRFVNIFFHGARVQAVE